MKKVSKKKQANFIKQCYEKLGYNYLLLENENKYLKRRLAIIQDSAEAIDEVRVKKLEKMIRKLKKDNFILAAGQCVIGEGIISGEYGHSICPKEYKDGL